MKQLNTLLRYAFFILIVRPLVLVIVGLNVRHRERLPPKGPAILIANHNSHLDTVVLMSLFPLGMLPVLRPVAAADYFLRNKLIRWFSQEIMGVIPVNRKQKSPSTQTPAEILKPVFDGLAAGNLIIFFPEGSRGEPEKLTQFKSGIATLAEQFPEVPVIPFFLHGLGKSLPKGEALLVPFFCDVFVGEKIFWNGNKESFLASVESSMKALASEGSFSPWD
jgi:1-acyl-sn-glycerol-3-phosphate acyltransferase